MNCIISVNQADVFIDNSNKEQQQVSLLELASLIDWLLMILKDIYCLPDVGRHLGTEDLKLVVPRDGRKEVWWCGDRWCLEII